MRIFTRVTHALMLPVAPALAETTHIAPAVPATAAPPPATTQTMLTARVHSLHSPFSPGREYPMLQLLQSGPVYACIEKGVRLAQKMQVGPCIPVGIQL